MDGISKDENVYFTISYILMTVVLLVQVVYYSFMVYSYQNIKKQMVEKGRLLQILPIVSIATVSVQPNHLLSYGQPTCSVSPHVATCPGTPRLIDNKEVPPPYAP